MAFVHGLNTAEPLNMWMDKHVPMQWKTFFVFRLVCPIRNHQIIKFHWLIIIFLNENGDLGAPFTNTKAKRLASWNFLKWNSGTPTKRHQGSTMEKKIGTKLALAGEPKGKNLVGGWPTPLRNISQLGWWHPQYVEKNVPNHQPERFFSNQQGSKS